MESFRRTNLEYAQMAHAAVRSQMLIDKEGLLDWMERGIVKIREQEGHPSQTMFEMVQEFHEKQELDIGLNIEHHGMEYPAINRMFVMDEEYAEMKKELLIGTDKNKLAHELADLIYTVIGTAITFGIEIEPVFAEVHRCNMLKGPGFDKTNYVPPEIKV